MLTVLTALQVKHDQIQSCVTYESTYESPEIDIYKTIKASLLSFAKRR